jgi:hypothetical protein
MGEDDADVHRTERTGRSIGRSAVVPLKPDAALPIGALLTDRVATDTTGEMLSDFSPLFF